MRFLFFTSGDPCAQERDGLGDNHPLLPKAGLESLAKALRSGKGFIAIHAEANTPTLRALLGATVKPDAKPRVEPIGGGDLNIVQRSADGAPITWTRRECEGRVFATIRGHDEAEWKSADFRELLLGAIRWATHDLETLPAPTPKRR